MFPGSQEHFIRIASEQDNFLEKNSKFQGTLDAFCEFEFCGYVVSICHPTLDFHSISLIFWHLITLIYIFMDVKFQHNLRIGTWHIL